MSSTTNKLVSSVSALMTSKIVKPLGTAAFVIYFTLARWVIYFISYVGSLIVIELILLQNPHLSYFAHMVGIFAAFSSAVFSVVYAGFGLLTYFMDDGATTKKGLELFQLSIGALIGHFFVGVMDVILTPIWLVLEVLKTVMDYLIVPDGRNPDGTFICNPADDGSLYPVWKFKYMYTIGYLLEQFERTLDFEIKVSHITGNVVAATIGNPGLKVRKIIPWGGDALYDSVRDVQETNIIPSELMATIFGWITDFITIITGEYAGTDVLKHFVYIDRLEFDSNNKIKPNQGSNPFGDFINNKRAEVIGCTI